MSDDRADLDALIDASEKVLKALADRYDGDVPADPDEVPEDPHEDAVPLVTPADDGAPGPKPRWVYMGACRYCGSEKPMQIFWRLKAVGVDGLSGSQLKISAVWWPWAECESCGHQSEGKVTHSHDDDE